MQAQVFLTLLVRRLPMVLSFTLPWSGTWRSLWRTACSSRTNFILPDKFQMRDVVINVSHCFCCQHIRIDHCRPFLKHHKFQNCDGSYYFRLMSSNFLTFKSKAARQSDFKNLRMSPNQMPAPQDRIVAFFNKDIHCSLHDHVPKILPIQKYLFYVFPDSPSCLGRSEF